MKFVFALVSLVVAAVIVLEAVPAERVAVSIRLPPSGETYTSIPINTDDTIKVLRDRVTQGDKSKAKNSYLLFNDRLLSDQNTVGSYGLWNASLVDYVVWAGSLPSTNKHIYIENLVDGKFTQLPLNVTSTVGSVKEFINKQFHVRGNLQYLLFEGHLLADWSAPLGRYNVKENSCIGWVAHAN